MYSSNVVPAIQNPASQSVYYPTEDNRSSYISDRLNTKLSTDWTADWMKEQQMKNMMNTQLLNMGTQATSTFLPTLMNMNQSDLRYSQNVGRGFLKNPIQGWGQSYDTLAAHGAPKTLMGRTLENPAFGTGVGTVADIGGNMLGQRWSDDDPTTFTGKEMAARAIQSGGKGAKIGAQIGSVIPVVGTAIGSLAGATIGAWSGLFKGKKERDEARELEKEHTQDVYTMINKQKELDAEMKTGSGSDMGFTAISRMGGPKNKNINMSNRKHGGHRYLGGGHRYFKPRQYDEGGQKWQNTKQRVKNWFTPGINQFGESKKEDVGNVGTTQATQRLDLGNVSGETPDWMLRKILVAPEQGEFMDQLNQAAQWIGSSNTLAGRNYRDQLMYGQPGEYSAEEKERIMNSFENIHKQNVASNFLSDLDYLEDQPTYGPHSPYVTNLKERYSGNISPYKDFKSTFTGSFDLKEWEEKKKAWEELARDEGLDLSAEQIAMIQQNPDSYLDYFNQWQGERPGPKRRGGPKYMGGGRRYMSGGHNYFKPRRF